MKTRVITFFLGFTLLVGLVFMSSRVASALGPFFDEQTVAIYKNATKGSSPTPATITATDPEGDNLTFTVTGGTGQSAFNVGSTTGLITVANRAAPDYETTQFFWLQVEVEEEEALTPSATNILALNEVSDEPPVIDDQTFNVDENSPQNTVVGTVTVTDPDLNDTTAFEIIGGSGEGTFSIDNNGTIRVSVPANLDHEVNPTFDLEVEVEDSDGLTDAAAITINVNDIDEPPTTTGIPDLIVNQGVASRAIDLWNYFDDAEDDVNELVFSVTGNTNPAMFDSLNVNNGAGSLTLDFVTSPSGSADLTVTATDTGGQFVESTFTVDINEAPVATDTASVTVDEDSNNVNVNLYPLFSDAEEADSALTYTVFSNTNQSLFSSTTIAKPNLVLDFAPNAFGIATITVRATDVGGLFAQTTVNVTVNAVNDAPTGSINDVNVVEDAAPVNIDLRAQFSDVEDDDDELTYAVVSNTNQNLFSPLPKDSINPTTDVLTLSFKPNTSGTATLTVRATDTGGKSGDATFDVTVSSSNDTPTVTGWSETTQEDTELPFSEADFASRFSDDDGDDLVRVRITQLPDKGSLKVGATTVLLNGEIDADELDDLVFFPQQNWDSGSTSFKWTGSDGLVYASQAATVTINVTAVNDAPTVSDFAKSGDENEVINFSQTDFANAFNDVDGDSLDKIRIDKLPANGTLRLGATAVTLNQQIVSSSLDNLSFTPDPSWNGTTTIDWSGNDGELYSVAPATITITINPSNDPPEIDLNGPQNGVNFAATFNSNIGPVSIVASNMTVVDVDSPNLQSATIRITNRQDGSAESLAVNTAGTNIQASYSSGSGILTLTGVDTVANYQQVLRTATYNNTSEAPNPTNRSVTFRAYDGQSFSNQPVTTVSLVNPRIQLVVQPELQTIISGTSAVFTINITNVGDVPLENLRITSSAVADCNKDPLVKTLAADESLPTFSCTATGVTQRIDNVLEVIAEDSTGGPDVTDTATAIVRIDNPNIQVDVFPLLGDTVASGGDARFGIIVLNPAQQSTLNNVQVRTFLLPLATNDGIEGEEADPIEVTSCAFNVGTVPGGMDKEYECTIPDVADSFTVEVVASGRTSLNQPVEDFDQANMFVLDLLVEVTSQPFELPVGRETDVRFTVTLTNLGGKALGIDGLTSFDANNSLLHGNLLNSGNSIVSNNTCATLGPSASIPAGGGTFACSYDVAVIGVLPSYTNVIAATASDINGNEVSDRGETVLTVTDEVPVRVTLTADPSILIAPDGEIELIVQVANNQTSEIQLTALADDELGNLDGVGSCELPQTIAANDSYICSYTVEETGQVANTVLQYSVTATVSGEVLEATVDVPVKEKGDKTAAFPVIANGARIGEPNNGPCDAMAIMPNLDYYFYSDDPADWYKVTLDATANVVVEVSNFYSAGQLLVLSGQDCTNPTMIGQNGVAGATTRELTFNGLDSGTYYIWVPSDNTAKPYSTLPYILRVDVSIQR